VTFATFFRAVTRLLCAAIFISLLTAAAGESSKRRNAAILARVLSYERTLEQRMGDAVGVAVVYKRNDRASEANADDWFVALDELSSVKIKDRRFFAVKVAYDTRDLLAAIDRDGVDVILVCDGLAPESGAIAEIARSRHTLTVSNAVATLGRDLTLCVTEEDEKTKIFINLNTAQLEGIQFSSALLKLATLVH
jgi:hypothetical protein